MGIGLLCGALGCEADAVDADLPEGSLYITSGATDEVFRLDARNGTIADTFRLDPRRDEIDEPHGIAVAPDGRYWYATLSHGEPTLWKFERPSDRRVGRVALGTFGASRIGLTPDGERAFIPDYYRSGRGRASGLAVVDLGQLSVVARPTVCAAPHDAKVDPRGKTVAIACSLSDEVVIIDANTLAELDRFHVASAPGPPGSPRYKPLNLVWSPDGELLYVGLFATGELRAFTRDGVTVGKVAVGAGPAQLAIAGDGSFLVVANRNDASASLVQLPALAERVRVRLDRPHPHGVALAEDDRTAFITYEGDTSSGGGVIAIDIESASLLWAVEAGAFTLGIDYIAAGPP